MDLLYFMGMCVSLNICMCTTQIQDPAGVRKVTVSPVTRVTEGYDTPCGCWEMNLGPLQEQQVLVLLAAEPPFLPQSWLIFAVTPLILGPIKRHASGWSLRVFPGRRPKLWVEAQILKLSERQRGLSTCSCFLLASRSFP